MPESPEKRTKTTEISDLPDASVSDDKAEDVKGGGLIVPCVRTFIPCVRSLEPCLRPAVKFNSP